MLRTVVSFALMASFGWMMPLESLRAETAIRLEKAEAEIQPVDEKPLRSLPALIEFAEDAIKRFDRDVNAYTCVLLKREMMEGKLEPTHVIRLKIRPAKQNGDELITPHSIYARFVKPNKVEGREVLFVENERNGEFLVRRGGPRLPNLTLELSPDSRLAKAESNHSILDAGIRPMLVKLLQRMETQLRGSNYQLKFYDNAKIDGRDCEHIEVRQLDRDASLNFQVAKVYIDRELRLPVYFSSYGWPEKEGDKPVLQEQYVITRVNLNADLTDQDFDRSNPDYQFREPKKDRESTKAESTKPG